MSQITVQSDAIVRVVGILADAPVKVVGIMTAAITVSAIQVQGFLSPVPDGINLIFTIPDLPSGDAVLFDQIALRAGIGVNDDYTRSEQTITFNAGKQPASGAKPFMLYVKAL